MPTINNCDTDASMGKDDGPTVDIKGGPKVKIKEEDQPRAGIGVLKLKH